MKRTLLCTFTLCWFVVPAAQAFEESARNQAVTSALTWLQAQQAIEGSWPSPASEEEVLTTLATIAATRAIVQQAPTDPAVARGLAYLRNVIPANLDLIARHTELFADLGENTLPLESSLVYQPQTGVGGFAETDDYWRNNWDTLLGIRALGAIAEHGLGTTAASRLTASWQYWTTHLNADGTVGLADELEANVQLAALGYLTLLEDGGSVTDRDTLIATLRTWLLNQQAADGGFGASGERIHVTALAIQALNQDTLGQTARDRAVDFLLAHQQPNGSFQHDPYLTALALHALYVVGRPDLAVSRKTLTMAPTIPVVGAALQLQVTLKNLTNASVSNVTVALLANGALVSERTVTTTALSSQTVTFAWTPGVIGPTTLEAVADRTNAILEANEANNAVRWTINVVSREAAGTYDLATYLTDLTATDAASQLLGWNQLAPNQPITFRTLVHNLGIEPINAVDVKWWRNGTLRKTVRVNLNSFASQETTYTWTATAGTHTLKVEVVAPVTEATLTNNTAERTVTVGQPPTEAPAPPRNLRMTVTGHKTVTLTWDPPQETGYLRFHVYRNGVQLTTSPITSTTYTDRNMAVWPLTYTVYTINSQGTPSATPATASIIDLTRPTVAFTIPQSGDTLATSPQLRGTVDDPFLDLYEVEYGTGTNPTLWMTIQSGLTPVVNGPLGLWDSATLGNGTYTLRIHAHDLAGNVAETTATVTLERWQLNPITPEPGDAFPHFLPDGGWLLFGATRGTGWIENLWKLDLAAPSMASPLTFSLEALRDPAVNPANSFEVAYSARKQNALGEAVYLQNQDNTNLRRLTSLDGVFQHVSYAPDGTKLVTAKGDGNLYTMTIGGGSVTAITNVATNPSRNATFPTWGMVSGSDRIVFEAETSGVSQLWQTDPAGSTPIQITSGPSPAHQPSLAPRGTKVAFVAQPADEGFTQVFLKDLTRSTQPMQLTNLRLDARYPNYWVAQDASRERIIFATDEGLYLASRESLPAVTLTVTPTMANAPVTVGFTVSAGGSPTQYAWDFEGDGIVDTTETSGVTSHTYTSGGQFIPSVRVTFADGRVGIYTSGVTIIGTPTILVTGITEGATYPYFAVPKVTILDDAALASSTIHLNGADIFSGKPIGDRGSYTLDVAATDAVGNAATAVRRFTVRDQNDFTKTTFTVGTFADERYQDLHPDGTTFVFNADPNGDGKWEIYRAPIGGGAPTALTNGTYNDVMPRYSPDGSQMAFYSYRNGRSPVRTMNADGTNVREVSLRSANYYGAWSPDGTKLAYVLWEGSQYNLFIFNSDGSGNEQQLTFFDGLTLFSSINHVDWQGDWIVFGRWIDTDGDGVWEDADRNDVYRVKADGTAPPELLLADGEFNQQMRLSRDGRHLLLTSTRGSIAHGKKYLYVMHLETHAVKPLDTSAYVSRFDVAADDTKVLLKRSFSGNEWVTLQLIEP